MGSIWHIGINSPSSITDTFFVQAVSNCWMFPKLAGCSVVVVCLFFWEWKQELERRWRAETWDRTVWVEVQNRGSGKTGGLFCACLRTKLKQRSKAGVGKRERTWTEQICQIDTSSREDIFIFLFFPKSRYKNECVVCFFGFFFKRIKWRRGGVYGENTWWEQDIWRDGAKERSWKLGQYFRLSAVKVSSAVEHAAACVCTRKSTRVQNIYSVSSLCGFVHFFFTPCASVCSISSPAIRHSLTFSLAEWRQLLAFPATVNLCAPVSAAPRFSLQHHQALPLNTHTAHRQWEVEVRRRWWSFAECSLCCLWMGVPKNLVYQVEIPSFSPVYEFLKL